MSALREIVRDDALAIAKSCGHPTVEPRHVLWGVIRALQGDAPADIPFEGVLRLLEPHGTSDGPPAVPPEIEAMIETVTDTATALVLAHRLPADLGALPAGATTATATAPVADTEASILAELDALVGLDSVKTAIRRLLALQHLNEQRAAAGLPTVDASKHLVFTGDPGTGKTTVARLVGRLYKVVGLVSEGQLIETGRADLVAGYVGQTALKVQAVVQRALGGVLFIDEAYALAQGGYEDFGSEAIATLVQMMEDHRDDLAVIVAGYGPEMRDFIESNPGLRSRFTHYVEFPNYDADELVRIFRGIADTSQVTLAEGCDARARVLVDAEIHQPDFGNARFVRTMFEAAYANMAARGLADGTIDGPELRVMQPGALEDPGSGPHDAHVPIGFRPPDVERPPDEPAGTGGAPA